VDRTNRQIRLEIRGSAGRRACGRNPDPKDRRPPENSGVKAKIEDVAQRSRRRFGASRPGTLKLQGQFGDGRLCYLFVVMNALLKDLKHSSRMLLHAPSFTIAAIATLAIGIATNTASYPPSADTLYSTAWLDLSQEPILIRVPDSGGRFYPPLTRSTQTSS
jgi:hypothetical protein